MHAVVGALDAHRRLVQQSLGDRARKRLDALAIALAQRLPAPIVLGQHSLDDLVGARSQGRDRRHHLERAEPAREALDLLLDDRLRAAHLATTYRATARDEAL